MGKVRVNVQKETEPDSKTHWKPSKRTGELNHSGSAYQCEMRVISCLPKLLGYLGSTFQCDYYLVHKREVKVSLQFNLSVNNSNCTKR